MIRAYTGVVERDSRPPDMQAAYAVCRKAEVKLWTLDKVWTLDKDEEWWEPLLNDEEEEENDSTRITTEFVLSIEKTDYSFKVK